MPDNLEFHIQTDIKLANNRLDATIKDVTNNVTLGFWITPVQGLDDKVVKYLDLATLITKEFNVASKS